MKKIAIIGALVLAIGASMAAGTMAKYTQTLEIQGATVTAKKFNISQEFKSPELKIAPGETWEWEFDINTNDTEVDVDLDFTILFDKDSLVDKLIKDGKATFEFVDVTDGTANKDCKDFSYSTHEQKNHVNVKDHAVKQLNKYKLVLKWAEGDIHGGDRSHQGTSTGITIHVNGSQK